MCYAANTHGHCLTAATYGEHGMSNAETVKSGAMTVKASCQFTGLSRSFLYEAMDHGELKYIKCGRRRLIPRVELERYLADRLVAQ